ncbi:MAG: DUF1592 domain-containing protein [Planctomycetota bacterium]|nr:DUF1592 domain-containing protein [Planctomycetota bacterium]MDP6764228.1 DUF1592 domain-containing protein [Planctomycetota bacterium]MDP6988317.1 DUF1592 domain-containing protein [Planctomycetota bacterium]
MSPLRRAAPALFLCGPLASAAAPDEYESSVLPLVLEYCVDCHGGARPKGDVDLEQFRLSEQVRADPETWWTVRELLAAGDMPPEDEPAPSPSERAAMVEWIDAAVGRELDPDLPEAPGAPTLRRLNRTEYQNTVRDLYGVHFPAEKEFPADEVSNGFDNSGDGLSMSDLLVDKVLDAAGRVARAAIVVEGLAPPARRRFGPGVLSGKRRGEAMVLLTRGDVFVRHEFPRDGTYVLRARTWAQQAGDEVARMCFVVHGEKQAPIDVSAEREAPQVVELTLDVPGGWHRIAVRFLNDFYEAEHPDPDRRDRNLFVGWIEIEGPVDPTPPSAFQGELFVRFGPDLGRDRERAILDHLASRAWRRPASEREVARLSRLTPPDRPLDERVQIALEAILASPSFLYRFELDDARTPEDAVRELDGFELAARLAYFLWSSTPDEELSRLAGSGRLGERAVLDEQVTRLLADRRSRALVEGFAGQWLGLRSLRLEGVDPEAFPDFDEALRGSMVEETLAVFEALLRGEGDVWELIDGDTTFVDERLAAHYGIEDVEGPELRRVSLAETERRGVLGHASVLTLTSAPTRTSPARRGKWVLEALLGAPPPEPPPGTAPLDESPEASAAASLRERLERHRDDPDCASCHVSMDPLGFGLENYDAIGRWREEDASGFPLDASGVLPDGRSFGGPRELAALLRSDGRFVRRLTERLLVYALGRSLEPSDRPTLARILAGLDPDAPDLPSIVRGIVHSEGFRLRRASSR